MYLFSPYCRHNEKVKAAKINTASELVGKIPIDAERQHEKQTTPSENDSERVRELEREVMDLKISNRGKDFFIEQLKSGYEAFAQERQGYVEKLMTFNCRLDELENKLLQLDQPIPTERDETNPAQN